MTDQELRIPDVRGKRLGTAMIAYAECGWYVAPVTMEPGSDLGKNPGGLLGTGWPEKTTRDPKVIRGWFDTFKGQIKGIALHVGKSGAVAFDVDTPGKLSGVLATELNGSYNGPFQSTRDNDPARGHYLFRLPPGFMAGNSNGDLGRGWGDVRGLNGVVIVAPSVHEKEHGQYQWQVTGTLKMLPESLRPLLRPPGPGGKAVTVSMVEDFMATYDRGSDTRTRTQVLDRFTHMTSEGAYRHTAAYTIICQIARDAMRDRYPATDALEALEDLFHDAVADRGAASGEWAGVLSYAIGSVLEDDAKKQKEEAAGQDAASALLMGGPVPGKVSAKNGSPDPASALLMDDEAPSSPAPAPAAGVEKTPTHLPEGFWNARPELAHIRQAAHCRAVGADAVLYGVLTRISSLLPGDLRIDTGMMKPASLNLFALLIAESGTGKSGSSDVGADLVPVPDKLTGESETGPRYHDCVPMGSGEGLVEAYMGSVDTQVGTKADGSPKMGKVRRQVRNNVLFYVDEGKTITTLMVKREGATLGQTIRTAWNGTKVGQMNGTDDRTRLARDYSLGLLISFQPSTALAMLDGVDEGTPQRFLWVAGDDPTIPDEAPEDPGPLWGSTYLCELMGLDPFNDGGNVIGDAQAAKAAMGLAPVLKARLRREHLTKNRGQSEGGSFDSQRPLTMVKLSGLLAVLAGRTDITEDDWSMAATMWATSCAVRDGLLESRKIAALRKRAEEREAKMADAVAVKGAVNDEEVSRDRVARVALRKVTKGPCHRRDILNSIASRDRKDGAGSRAIDYALSKGWIQEDEKGVFTVPGA